MQPARTVERLLTRARVIAVSGGPGMGKSRLARRVARASRPATIVDLFGVSSARQLGARVASEVTLKQSEALLVLDHVDRVHAAAERLARALTARHRSLRVILVARRRPRDPHIPWLEVEPLSARQGGALLLRLASSRARCGDSHRDRDDAAPMDATTAQAIAARLGGMPLAIELLASRIAVLGPAEWLARLDDPLEWLSGSPAAPYAFRSVRESVEASLDLLAPSTQAVAISLAAFRGTFDGIAAEQLCTTRSRSTSRRALRELVACSLVRPTRGGYCMDALVRDVLFALLLRRRGAAQRLSRWRRVVTARAAASAEALRRSGARVHLDAIALARSDLEAIADSGLRGELCAELLDDALDAAVALEPSVLLRGPLDAHTARLADLVSRASLAGSDQTRTARACVSLGECLRARGRAEEALATLARAREIAGRSGDARTTGRALRAMAILEFNRGRLDRARALSRRALREHHRSGDEAYEAISYLDMACIAREEGDIPGARETSRRATEICERLGQDAQLTRVLANLGLLELDLGELEAADRLFTRARRLACRVGDLVHVSAVDSFFAALRQLQGRPHQALAACERSVAHADKVGHRLFGALYRAYRGRVLCDLGRWQQARDDLVSASDTLIGLDAARSAATFLSHAAVAFGASGDHLRAAELIERAEDLVAAPDSRRAIVDLHRACVELLSAGASTDVATREQERASARAVVLELSDRIGDPVSRDARITFHARIAIQSTRNVLDLERARELERIGLVVGLHGKFFSRGDSRVNLARRAVLARILSTLAERRVTAPGEPVPLDALVEAGWPNERIERRAAQNRLRVALATLRRMGLRTVLIRASDGYLVDPSVPLRHQSA